MARGRSGPAGLRPTFVARALLWLLAPQASASAWAQSLRAHGPPCAGPHGLRGSVAFIVAVVTFLPWAWTGPAEAESGEVGTRAAELQAAGAGDREAASSHGTAVPERREQQPGAPHPGARSAPSPAPHPAQKEVSEASDSFGRAPWQGPRTVL